MPSEGKMEEDLEKIVKLEIENEELKRRNERYEQIRWDYEERDIRSRPRLERELRSRSERVKYLRELSRFYSLVIASALVFFIALQMFRPFYSYLGSIAEIKQAELKSVLHQLEVDGVVSSAIPKLEKITVENDHGWMQGLWAFTRDWVFPAVLWIVIAGVLFYLLLRLAHISYSYYVAYTSNSAVKGVSFISVTASLLGFILTVVRYRHDLFENPAVEFVLYSTTFCLIFVFFLFAVKSLAAAIASVVVGAVLLLSVSLMRGGIFVFAKEYVEMISETSVPNGAFLLFATLCPIVFILVISVAKIIAENKTQNQST